MHGRRGSALECYRCSGTTHVSLSTGKCAECRDKKRRDDAVSPSQGEDHVSDPNSGHTTNSVQIEALTVEVEAIKIGKKQMTMGLFRQLPQRAIIDETTCEILGTPWCSVNYFWGDC